MCTICACVCIHDYISKYKMVSVLPSTVSSTAYESTLRLLCLLNRPFDNNSHNFLQITFLDEIIFFVTQDTLKEYFCETFAHAWVCRRWPSVYYNNNNNPNNFNKHYLVTNNTKRYVKTILSSHIVQAMCNIHSG